MCLTPEPGGRYCMATINEAIINANRLHPDCYGDDVKTAWLCELDGKIARETMHKSESISYSYPDDADKALLVPPPYDNIYELYIIAMGDFFSGELASYSASAAMFERAYEEFRKSYIRRNMPPQSTLKL